jgi:uncharacterized protein
MESALCVGNIRHRRFTPVKHDFTYPIFMAMLDIDAVAQAMKVSPFSSYNKFNWTAFDERDHFGDPTLTLRQRLAIDAKSQGVNLPDGQIFLLTHLRYCGYIFNPVSFFYCYDKAQTLQVILAEVNNTFGDSENYWLTSGNEWRSKKLHRYRDAKRMHVSPFNHLNLDYTFIFNDPQEGKNVMVHMNTIEDGRANLDATLKLERRQWSRKSLHQTLIQYPFMTAKVIARIHWQALKLYLKGAKFYSDPGVRQKQKQQSESRDEKGG